MEASLVETLLIALVIGAASGAVGSFILLKRMALVGDALSHVALPGIALALIYHFDPFWGVLSFLLGAAILVWYLEQHTRLPSDALVGLLFTASLAIGILSIPGGDVIDSLFGEFPAFSPPVLVSVIATGVVLTILVFFLTRKFLFSIVSNELARVQGGGGTAEQLVLLLIFSGVVALGIKLVGTLLMGALTIIPASIAKNISTSARRYILLSTGLGGFIATIGAFASHTLHLLPGPTIILLGAGIFVCSLIFWRE
ncbi:MAG: metal ABC transporter permease [Candidatus Sungbacteria bacterium]|nr:metal ABC transporter permease [Candidatus Sungbacteria bacterium]